MALLPSVLIADIHQGKAEEIIKLIVNTEDISENEIPNGAFCFKWRIDNKYYQADVNFCPANLQSTFAEDFQNSVEAVILHFDVNRENLIDDLNKWLTYLEKFHITEKILLCRTCKGLSEIKKDAVNDWCVKNEYELVELEPDVEEGGDIYFGEAIGIDRVNEILQSHQWPNLIRKEKIIHNINTSNGESSEVPIIETQVFENSNNAKNQNDEFPVDEEEFKNMEQLSIIFKNLTSMKSEMSSLTTEQKLDQAEKVVKAFWNAVGGDSDEFSDSDDNENVCS